MSSPLKVLLSAEQAYLRKVILAVEVLDAVTLARVAQGIEVIAEGLGKKPIVNASGLFVWVNEDVGALQRIKVDPRNLTYTPRTVELADVKLPPQSTIIELAPNAGYLFSGGVTGLRGTLIERRLVAPLIQDPIVGADVRLRWLDDDGVTWRDAPTVSRTNDHGDFVVCLRPGPADKAKLNADGTLTVRLIARRASSERKTSDLKLMSGRIAEPLPSPGGPNPLIFAWDELQPGV